MMRPGEETGENVKANLDPLMLTSLLLVSSILA